MSGGGRGGGGGGRFMVGEYVVGKQIGSGSFSTVWHARHRVHFTEVAIKEIATARLNSKLQESLKSEIFILRKINHPNIIRLHDMIEEPGKIYIILEYCQGGDLSVFIQQCQGRIPEATAKHFMQQLASGLKVLRENNLIHRDLKPQNLLLFTNDDKSVLKIADFGFARSLQPRGLAETLCGSPLYMAPEIMQLQKYDAKADLWSVGTILFQLVTGRTPFTGNNQIQLLQNIVKSTELQFPPEAKDLSPQCIDLCQKLLRRNPVERLTFEEFFNHPFLSQRKLDEALGYRRSHRSIDGFPTFDFNSPRNTDDSSQDDCLPFSLDDDSSGPEGSPSFMRRSSRGSASGISVGLRPDRKDVSKTSNEMGLNYGFTSSTCKPEITGTTPGSLRVSRGHVRETIKPLDHRPMISSSKGSTVVDSMELVDQEYVLVSSPPINSSSSVGASRRSNFPSKSGFLSQASENMKASQSAPVPIISSVKKQLGCVGSSESHSSAPGTSQGSMDVLDTIEQSSTDCMTRIESLQRGASAITELVNAKIDAGKPVEALSIQLVILAIWKQALDICHTQAASAIEESPKQATSRIKEITAKELGDTKGHFETANTQRPPDICSVIESAFLVEVGNAEELAKVIEPGNTEMPDAMEMIFQSALSLGRRGAVEEYMENSENAVLFYSKSVRLLSFLLEEAPSLILNPPFSLTTSERYRLRNYIDVLNNRQSISMSQKLALLKCRDPPCLP